ncbi:TPM domain-containing protein [Acinetobacter sp. A47]|uniref:TPM domain-containing protein n=1 Tax=Acinetobacter sp. A47 TaxID=1561217 RepID=UPI00056E55AA|nr:TPM domain-containing protein [Acinetobacter sp. A47]
MSGALQQKRTQPVLAGLLLLFATLCFQHTVWAEVATATDQSDLVVAGKIIQEQQTNKTAPASSTNTETSVLPKVADDMAEGESIRDLPSLNQPVIDQAKILSDAELQQLNQKILSLYQQGKAQVGVIIVPTTGQEAIFDFALRAGEKWQLGSAKRDNGLLMAIAVNDRKIQILTGYGLEGVLPDLVLSRIIRNQITPAFKQGQYAQGISAGLDEISRIVNLDPEVAQQAAQELKERHEQALHAQQARENTLTMALFILIAGVIGSFIVGNRLSASTAAVAATAAGLVNGAGLVMSLLLGVGIFFLLITSLAQLIFQMFLSGSGRGGGGGGGGFGGGGGYSGGGGSFGGGGASGSW